jgi:hypothetical protein
VCLGHQVDPLVTAGGADAAVGGVDGGLIEFGELAAPELEPEPELPAGTVELVAPVFDPAW